MTTAVPVRILLSEKAHSRIAERLVQAAGGRALQFVLPGEGPADIAFVSRDVTGLSTKHQVIGDTQIFYDSIRRSEQLQWVHIHSAGADRPIFVELHARKVSITTSAGSNAAVVAQTALAGLLSLARQFPQLMQAQNEHRWAPLIGSGLPRDIAGQTAVIVGWGAIGQYLARFLQLLGMNVVAVRRQACAPIDGVEIVSYDDLTQLLPRADWLLLACPLTERTRNLVNAETLALMPRGAHLINVARGEVVDEPALIEALKSSHLAGAHLDVFAHEPLAPDSALWDMPQVITTPHSAGFSDGNTARVEEMFLANFARWIQGHELNNLVP